ncbi:MAG: hypothetical protein ACLGGX_12080, partial [Bdellovibrionia bacterium]
MRNSLKFWMTFFVICFYSFGALANSLESIAQRCGQPQAQEPKIFSEDFKWGYDLLEMLSKFSEMYKSPKRLDRRAYWNPDRHEIALPYYDDRGGDIVVNLNFVNSVARHIERAFEMQVVDAVFFPDMGHSHLLIPATKYNTQYKLYPVEKMRFLYEDLFKDNEVKILYHTAEQLKMLDENDNLLSDPKIRWRHHTRNIVGEINPQTDLFYVQNPDSKVNTAHGLEGYEWWGGGYNLSANEKGCFSYTVFGKTYYFDISMFDLD